MSISECVSVPVELTTFVSDPKFTQILLKVKDQSGINTIAIERSADHTPTSILIDAPTGESAMLVRKLLEMHFKQQTKLVAAESRLQKVQMELFATQGEMASGLMIDFTVNPSLLGLVIGKKGSRIKQVTQDCGVTHINVDETGEQPQPDNNK